MTGASVTLYFCLFNGGPGGEAESEVESLLSCSGGMSAIKFREEDLVRLRLVGARRWCSIAKQDSRCI